MQVHFDPLVTTQGDVLAALIDTEALLPASIESLTFPGRRITFPVVLDDRWNREALEKYMRNTRDTAAYLPSNVEYLARNNGLSSGEEALKKLVTTDWVSSKSVHLQAFADATYRELVFGVGFYLACPFLVPVGRGITWSSSRVVDSCCDISRSIHAAVSSGKR